MNRLQPNAKVAEVENARKAGGGILKDVPKTRFIDQPQKRMHGSVGDLSAPRYSASHPLERAEAEQMEASLEDQQRAC